MIYIADENDEGKRLDVRIAEVLSDVSRSKIQAGIKNGSILVNGCVKKSSYTLRDEDVVSVDDVLSEPIKILPEDIPLNIVYEDDGMLVVNKPSGMLTHPTNQEVSGTLVNALLYKYGDNLSDINGEYRRGIVHRLDRNTSGLLMVAKNNKVHEFLQDAIKEHKIEKKYRAVLKGVYPNDEEIINLPIGRNPKQPHKMMVCPDGKESITVVNVIKRYNDATAVELSLITGRTHQIRVHMSNKGYPVFNDTLYGAGMSKVITQEQVLQSFSLRFTKPFSDEIISLEIPSDEKYNKVIKYLEGREK